jgi:hypothetical protein
MFIVRSFMDFSFARACECVLKVDYATVGLLMAFLKFNRVENLIFSMNRSE